MVGTLPFNFKQFSAGGYIRCELAVRLMSRVGIGLMRGSRSGPPMTCRLIMGYCC